MYKPIAGVRDQRVRQAGADGAQRRSDPNGIGAETQAAPALVIAVEPLVANIGDQEDRGFLTAAGMKGMGLPRVDGDAGTLIDQMRRVAERI